MKNLKKILALVMVVAMMAALGVCAFADVATGTGDITVKNSAKGETYTVYKLFDAAYDSASKATVYYGTIPEALKSYFTTVDVIDDNTIAGQDTIITKTSAADDEEKLAAAVADYASKNLTAVTSAQGTGGDLVFENLAYGYYVILSTQTAKDADAIQAIIDSNTPSATVYEKSETTPITDVKKVASPADVSIGDTVTYTLSANTSNFVGTGEDAEQVLNYYVKDEMPAFLDLKTVAVYVSTDKELSSDDTKLDITAFTDSVITIAWTDGNGTSLYNNGSYIFVVYTAQVNDKITAGQNADGTSANKNEVTFSYDTKTLEPWATTDSKSATNYIYTYSAAIQKTDSEGKNLKGATFQVQGLTVAEVTPGVYNAVSYNASSEDYSAVMSCNDDGYLVINGLSKNVSLTVKEAQAPTGYNKLDGTFTVTPVVAAYTVNTTKSDTTTSYSWTQNEAKTAWVLTSSTTATGDTDSKTTTIDLSAVTGTKVVNYSGAELPSTGGMGTTIFYVIGGIMVLGAGILLVTKKRMAANG